MAFLTHTILPSFHLCYVSCASTIRTANVFSTFTTTSTTFITSSFNFICYFLILFKEHIFKGDRNLKKINKPEKLEVIKEEAFEGCENLEELVKENVNKHADRVYGDVTMDKKVDVTDLTNIALHVIGDKKFDEDQTVVADVEDDDNVNLADLAALKMKLVGRDKVLGPKPAEDILAVEETEVTEDAAE